MFALFCFLTGIKPPPLSKFAIPAVCLNSEVPSFFSPLVLSSVWSFQHVRHCCQCIGCGDEEMLSGLLINTAPILASLLTTSPTRNCHTLETQHLAKGFPPCIFSSLIPLWTRIQTTHSHLRNPQRHLHSNCDSEISLWLRFFFHCCMLV